MLATTQRLRRSDEFAATIRKGRRAGRGFVVVHLSLPSPESQSTATPARAGVEDRSTPTRVGFVVSKAVGKAVQRNLVKRRLRHLARDRLAELPAGSTLVVRALSGAADASYGQLGADLDAAIAAARAGRGRNRGRRS